MALRAVAGEVRLHVRSVLSHWPKLDCSTEKRPFQYAKGLPLVKLTGRVTVQLFT